MILLLIACEGRSPPSMGKPEDSPVPKVIIEREKGSSEEPLPEEVRVKLKRDGKDNYSWEISGSDVDQILKVNEKLRKQLGGRTFSISQRKER
jgi:hypothetical protein